MDVLNARFKAARPSNELGEAGVLVHQFDGWQEAARPWRPCPGACKYQRGVCETHLGCENRNRVNAMLLGVGDAYARPLYSPSTGGTVLSPTANTLVCSYPRDGFTAGSRDGCNGNKGRGWCNHPEKGCAGPCGL